MRTFRLIKGATDVPALEPKKNPFFVAHLPLVCAILFFALKFPLCFVSNNPEELRDYDHYSLTSHGELPYRHFVWLYGPITPLVYGTLLKIFPDTLLTLRIFTLFIWSLGALLLARILARYLANPNSVFLGVFFASGLIGYPGYSHNHPLVAVSVIGTAYFLLKYIEENAVRDAFFSFACALVSFYGRPVLMGYGVLAAWLGVFLGSKGPSKLQTLTFSLSLFLSALFFFFLVYGSGLSSAFNPKPWAVLEAKNYPNLHYLIPHYSKDAPHAIGLYFRQVRAALETLMFYLHYFIWPAVIFTLFKVLRFHVHTRAAAVCTLFGLAGSFDLLHYGFSAPLMEQAVTVRGQFFFSLSACAIFLVLWPSTHKGHPLFQRLVSGALLLVIGLWQYLPLAAGASQLISFHRNEFNFPALKGIVTHPDRRGVFEAITYINSLCAPNDTVVIPQYDPGLEKLLKCHDLFSKDSYMFTRFPWYVLAPEETPYAISKMTNEEAIEQRIRDFRPRFYLMDIGSTYSKRCDGPEWTRREFGTGVNARRVCVRIK